MKKFQKNAAKILVMVALFSSAAFADGDMGGGGLADSGLGGKTEKSVTTRTTEDGDMGGGGISSSSYFGSVMDSIFDYFDRMM